MHDEPVSDPLPPLPDLVSPPAQLPAAVAELRARVRAFLAEELAAGAWQPRPDAWLSAWDERFTKELARRGLIGITIPTEYGGRGGTQLERYVVIEELLAAGAPVAAHWIADRQVAPALLRFGSPKLREKYLPRIAAGECYFGIGMSEPDTGSDLASVRSQATRVEGGWRLNGAKIWTSGAHRAHAFIALVRTSPRDEHNRHAGLSQFVVDLDWPGVQIRPIPLLTGEHHFNEVVFDDVFVPDDQVLGEVGAGWHQVTSELAYERSGPERFLSTFPLLAALVGELAAAGEADAGARRQLGFLVARLWTLRQLSLGVAAELAAGKTPDLAAALVKELGTRFESEIIDAARLLVRVPPDPQAEGGFARLLADAVLHAPGFTLRGGTTEVLRGIIARGLGLR